MNSRVMRRMSRIMGMGGRPLFIVVYIIGYGRMDLDDVCGFGFI